MWNPHIVLKKDGWGLPIRQINELRYVGEGGDDCSLPIVRGTSGAKETHTVTSLWRIALPVEI